MVKKAKPVFQVDQEIITELSSAQWQFDQEKLNVKENATVFELRIKLASPAAITVEKANAPAVGLPSLDGFLSYVAFCAAVDEVCKIRSELAQRVLWQWNVGLRNSSAWVDFKLPIQKVKLHAYQLYDCSVGLPITDDGILYPAGSLFTSDGDKFRPYPEVMDSIPLRRRVVEPYGRPIKLKGKLNSSSGKTKALDNRLYFALTQGYRFLFRGDPEGVKRLLSFAMRRNIGLGKKTSLGFGRIASFEVKPYSTLKETWCKSDILINDRKTLIKSVPFDVMLSEKEGNGNLERFLGCKQFSLQAIIETFGSYSPPYWLRERRTRIILYGSIIQERLIKTR